MFVVDCCCNVEVSADNNVVEKSKVDIDVSADCPK